MDGMGYTYIDILCIDIPLPLSLPTVIIMPSSRLACQETYSCLLHWNVCSQSSLASLNLELSMIDLPSNSGLFKNSSMTVSLFHYIV